MFRKVILSLGCTLELPGQLSKNPKAWPPPLEISLAWVEPWYGCLFTTPPVVLTSSVRPANTAVHVMSVRCH